MDAGLDLLPSMDDGVEGLGIQLFPFRRTCSPGQFTAAQGHCGTLKERRSIQRSGQSSPSGQPTNHFLASMTNLDISPVLHNTNNNSSNHSDIDDRQSPRYLTSPSVQRLGLLHSIFLACPGTNALERFASGCSGLIINEQQKTSLTVRKDSCLLVGGPSLLFSSLNNRLE
ncbi:hypothetical protein G7046_g8104 [Stylonectria norvegica]|nr:hypothetical protein G7046_g8104 [Stylonectria norvegica]